MSIEIVKALIPPLYCLLGLGMLSFYRIHKKFKQERTTTKLAFLESNIVELIYLAVLAPDTGFWLTKLIG